MKKVRLPKSLKFKVAIHVATALTVAVAVFTLFIARHHNNELLEEAQSYVRQLSEVITKSTRFAMIQNQRSSVHQIIKNIGEQEKIQKVRILDKNGMIIHSTRMAEIATSIDMKTENCVRCHEGSTPPLLSETSKRSCLFIKDGEKRYLGSIEVIRNSPSCYENVLCHAHPKEEKVLGIIEISYDLSSIDAKIREDTLTIAGFSLGLVLVASLMVSLFVHHMVYVPLRDLETGAKRLRSGNLEELIPIRSRDEFGHLASSFNAMTIALRNSELELQEWNETLAERVREKTGELQFAKAKTAHAEKLASVGLLAAGIAHELNNPLTGILTFSTLIRKKFDDDSSEGEDLDLIIRETKRCSVIIRRLLDFAREKKPEKHFADINAVINDTVQILKHPASSRDIDIVLNLSEDLPPLWVDPDQMEQIFMNVLVNARDAISSKGTIKVSSRIITSMEQASGQRGNFPLVEVSITDDGSGIPDNDLQKLFDPFFTTKSVGSGTGLGLSVSYGIVQSHGGTIEVESAVGEGTTFRIFLPAESQPEHMTGV